MTTTTTDPANTTVAADAVNGAVGPATSRPMTPAAAVARHIEWLEHALVVAREEELRRQGRLEKASDKNRDKRTARLAEVVDEVRELEALVTGIKELQARTRTARGAEKRTTKPAVTRTTTRRSAKTATA